MQLNVSIESKKQNFEGSTYSLSEYQPVKAYDGQSVSNVSFHKLKHMKLIVLVLVTFVSMRSVMSQPNTEVFLFDLEKVANENYILSSPSNISNNIGYDNQPSFWPDGKSILYAGTVGGQTEIVRYFMDINKTQIITNTPEGSEYSPTPTPGGKISSIRLDTSGLQLLYIYDLNGASEVLVEDLAIGYHAWHTHDGFIAFVLGQPNTLQYIDLKSKKTKILASNIGRSLHKIPGSKNFSYVDKSGDWTIKAINPKNGKKKHIVRVKEGSEDYCWTPQGEIVMGQGSVLWVWDTESGWKQIADLKSFGLEHITRLAISPKGNQLAVVVND